jgi:methyl-accepting chemotaxis protein
LNGVNLQNGHALQFTEEGLAKAKNHNANPASVAASWQVLKETQSHLSVEESAKQHDHLVASVRAMIVHAGENSNLVLDPDLDSAFLTDLTLIALPQNQERLAQIATFGVKALTENKFSGQTSAKPGDPLQPPAHNDASEFATLGANATAENQLSTQNARQLAIYQTLLNESDVDRVNRDADTALTRDAEFYGMSENLQNGLPEPLKEYKAACAEFSGLISTAIADPTKVNDKDFFKAGQKARGAAARLWNVSHQVLGELLQTRVRSIRTERYYTLITVSIGLLVSIFISVRLSRSITRPLAALTSTAEKFSRGDNEARAPILAEDELGDLAKSFNLMIAARLQAQTALELENQSLQASIHELLVVVSDASDGKLGVRARVSEGVLGNVADALNLMLENVGELIANAKSASNQVASAASGITSMTQELERGEKRQSTEISATSDGVRDLNDKAQAVLLNCQSATNAAQGARRAAEEGAKAVREVIKGMEKIRGNTQVNTKKIKRLGDRSMEIAGIVRIIGDISAKTDMLSLNASIEAARAGEQGRGFTVVADQVRGLADRTRTLTNQIEKLVNDIQQETSEAVVQMESQTQEVEVGARAAEAAGGTLENIVTVSSESSDLVFEINKAATQQAARTQEMLLAVDSINRVSAEAQVKVRETRTTSEKLTSLSVELNKRLAQFEVETVVE